MYAICFSLLSAQVLFCTVFFLHLCYYYLLFKAVSLDGRVAFLVAVHYMIFLVIILYASLENKFFFFFFFFFHATTAYGNKKAMLKQEDQLMLTNLRDVFVGQSMSPNMVPFHMLHIVSYCATVTLSLRPAVFTIFDFKNVVTLKAGSEFAQGH